MASINKKGWVTKDLVIAMLVFSAIIGIWYLMTVDLAYNYDKTSIVDSEFKDKYDYFENNTETISEMFDATNSKTGLGLVGTVEIMLASTFTIITLIFGSISIISSQAVNFMTDFGVPHSLAVIGFGLITCVIAAVIIFIIVNAVNRQQRL